jgi:pimeloyl-ACP methyl ester carboxylesterase
MKRNGQGHSRAAIYALHCSGGSPRQWERLRKIARRPVCAPALLARAPKTDAPFRLEMESEPIVLDILAGGMPVHLAGHSYGGAVAINIAMRIPDMVLSLSLYEPAAFHLLDLADAGEARAMDELRRLGRRISVAVRGDDASEAARLLVDYWGGGPIWPSLSEAARGKVREHLPKARAEFDAMSSEPHPLASYRALDVPCLILKGSSSFNPASLAAEKLALTIPHARNAIVEGASHMGPLTHADAVAGQISSFCDGAEAARSAAA